MLWLRQPWNLSKRIPSPPTVASPPAASLPAPVPKLIFADVTVSAGLRFTHVAGATGQRWYPETIGSGVAFFDYDGDRKPDILFVNGQNWPSPDAARQAATTLQLYRNNGTGGFDNVTESAGLAVPLYGMGVAVGDYDNDGDRDVFVSGYQRHLFFVNQGNGTFIETAVGIGSGTWGTGAAFFDYDRDGWLDLVLGSYVTWSPELEAGLDCTYGTPHKDYCPVRYFKGEGLSLYRNQGDGTFRDGTDAAGVASPGTRAFAPAIFDFDDDGWLDIFVASDGTPSRLWRNRGDGTFEDVGVQTGIVLDESGAAYAGMGIDITFPRNDDQLCVAIGNFVGEPTTLHCRVPQGDTGFHPALYADMSARTGVGRRTLQSVTFGLFFLDVDLDGFQDLFMVNGHVVDEARLRNAPRAQRPQLFRNTGTGRFQEITAPPGSGLDRLLVGRGAAYADYDGDGDPDIVVQQNQGPALLLRNDLTSRPHFLRVQLTGTKSNRDGIGADVRVHTDAGIQRQMLRTGVSYLSQSDFPLLFGLGQAKRVTQVEIIWPSGITDVYQDVAVNTTLKAVEGQSRPASTSEPLATTSAEQAPATSPHEQAFPTHVRAGIEAYHQEDFSAAAKAFEAAFPLRPEEPTPYRYLADLYWRQGQHGQAEEAVRQLVKAMPDAYFLDRQGSGYEASELLGLAQLLYREAARLDPSFPSARYNLGRTYLEQGETAQGIEEIQAAIRLHPEFAEAHETLGLAYIEQSQWEDAIRHLTRALDLKPDLIHGRNHLGRLYMAQGRLEAAISEFRQLVTHHPELAEVRHNLAVAYARHGQREQALRQFRAAIRLQPNFQAARLDFAALASDMGRYQEAIDMLEGMLGTSGASVSFDPVDVRYRLALVHLAAQNLPEAAATLQQVLLAQPGHAEAHVYLGSIYYRLGQFDPAWRHARQAEALGAPVAELIAALRRVSSEP